MAGPPKAKMERSPPTLATLMLGDFLVTLIWVLASSCFAEASAYFAKLTDLDELLLGIGITIGALALIGPVCQAFGGALFNPSNSIALVSSGKGSIPAHVVRMLGQLAGALAGSVVAREFLPDYLQGKFHTLSGGIKEGVAFEWGLAAEGTMSFVLNYIFLVSLEADSKLFTLWMPMLSTVALSWIGFYFTGPSLNPFVSFSWHFHYKTQDDLEHWLVFWSAPILGAIAAGVAHRYVSKAVAAATTPSHGSTRRSRKPSKSAIEARKQMTAERLAHAKKE